MNLPAIRRRHAKAIKRCRRYTLLRRGGKGLRPRLWYVVLKIEHQYFSVKGEFGRSRREAEWSRIMLCVALDRLLDIAK